MANLKISHLAKSYSSKQVLRDMSFAVETGNLIAILGASGSGKSTLLRLIAGFERPDAGEIKLAGEIIASETIFKRPEQRGIGYVAQDGALFPHLSVADNITFGLSRAERRGRHRVTELLAMVDLPAEYADRAPQALSGGEQQRIAIARALAPRPKLLLLDEPFSALDAGLREETRLVVAAAIRGASASAILVTHDQAEALSMGSLVGVLQDGQLAQMSPPETLYRYPINKNLADFVGEAVFCSGIAANGVAHCLFGDLRLVDGSISGQVEVMVRPEQIKILSEPQEGGISAAIKHVTFYGHDAVVRLSVNGAPPEHDINARVFSQYVPQAGSEVWLKIDGGVVAYPVPQIGKAELQIL